MSDTLGKILDILIAVIIMFLVPILYYSQKQDTVTQVVLTETTQNLVDTIATNGYITKNMYDEYIQKLDATGNIYNISLERKEKLLEPEYRFKTPEEIINERNNAWNGENNYTYVPVYTEKPVVTDLVNNDGLTMNTDTNESILARAVRGLADPNHVHSDECFGLRYEIDPNNTCTGTLHFTRGTGFMLFDLHNGTNTYYTPFLFANVYECSDCDLAVVHFYFSDSAGIFSFPYQWTIEINKSDWNYTSSGSIKKISQIVDDIQTQNMVGKTMTQNGPPFYDFTEAADYFESKMAEKGFPIIPVSKSPYQDHARICYYDNSSRSQSEFIRNSVMLDQQVVNGIPTLYTLPHYRLRETDPLCDQIIKSIIPTNPNQVIYRGESLITCAMVTYLDGSTEIVECSTSFNTNTIGNNIPVILRYTGLDTATTTKTFTCTIHVTIIPKTKVCEHGHVYNLNNDGTDPGCPYCAAWLASLRVYQPASGEISIYRGTTLEENGVIVLATYLNGRVEYLHNGYVDNLDNDYVGLQTVTIGYKGETTSLTVNVKRNVKQCDVCGRYYELNPDDSDPGCPYCASLIPVFTGNVMEYYDIKTADDILEELYTESGIYKFREGDYFKVDVYNKNKTLGMHLLDTIYHDVTSKKLFTTYGTKIRDTGQ